MPDIPKPMPVQTEPDVTDRVEIETSMGTIVVGLYGKAAPKTVANFLSYVDKGFYSRKIFHRVIPGFMIQGGGFDESIVKAEAGTPLRLEIIPGLKHLPGTLSMARTQDPHSATAQFFLCVAKTPQLNGSYAAFGMIEEGFGVAEQISRVTTGTRETERGPMNDVPVDTVMIESISRLD